jgi:hypothetical protein
MKVGDTYLTDNLDLRIMAIADKYVMLRYKGCMPFVESIKDFEKRKLQLKIKHNNQILNSLK